jgi:predicted phage terminase large subunit-like protein
MKSILACFWNVFVWTQDPGHRFLVCAHGEDLLEKQALIVKRLMSSDWFRTRYPTIQLEDSPIHALRTTAGGLRYSATPRGQIRGFHADTQILDDMSKGGASLTASELERVRKIIAEELSSRWADPANARRITIGQRLSVDDGVALAIASGARAITLPMRFEPSNPTPGDPRTKPGELMWPERFPKSFVDSREKELGSLQFGAQYQQAPVPAGGSVFRAEWIHHWSNTMLDGLGFTIRSAREEAAENYEPPPDIPIQICQSWDLSFKGGSKNDYVVGILLMRLGPSYFVLDFVRKRLDFPGTLAIMREKAKGWAIPGMKIGCPIIVEDKANGPAIVASLSKEFSQVIAVNPEGGKLARANAIAPFFEAGDIFLPPKEESGDLVVELLGFPNSGFNDDFVDALSQGITWLTGKGGETYERRAMHKKVWAAWGNPQTHDMYRKLCGAFGGVHIQCGG